MYFAHHPAVDLKVLPQFPAAQKPHPQCQESEKTQHNQCEKQIILNDFLISAEIVTSFCLQYLRH